MSMIPGIDASSSALTAERTRLDVIAGNLANANNTSDATG
jgi:flagellar basal body rod protein FlgC